MGGKSTPNGTGNRAFLCKKLGALLQWPHNMVGDELLGLGLFIGIDS